MTLRHVALQPHVAATAPSAPPQNTAPVFFHFFLPFPEHKWTTSKGPMVLFLITFFFPLDPVALIISYLGLQSNLK